MAPMACTSGETALNGPMLLEGLIDLYGRERVLYQEVLQLSRDQSDLVRAGESLRRIRHVLDAKRDRIGATAALHAGFQAEIARLERESGTARSYWERKRDGLGGSHPIRLQQSLHTVGELIEKILQVEAENDELFMGLVNHAV